MARIFLLIPAIAALVVAVGCAPYQPTAPTPGGAPVNASAPTTAVTVAAKPATASTTATPSTTMAVPRTNVPTPKITPTIHSRAACLIDENRCYEPGTDIKCQTGGCVNAARGITPQMMASTQRQWLKEHPGWCAVGTQGAVAPC